MYIEFVLAGGGRILKWRLRKIISFLLAVSIMISMIGCSGTAPNPTLSDPNSQIVSENIETENIITENTLTEFITSEIYLEEIIIAENKISELLLEEETITEVVLCKTVYVSQDNIEEFAENSQTSQLFGDDVDIGPLLTKVAVGTGVIVTLTVLKKAGFSDQIASIVVAAADESLKFAGTGAAIGSLFGGLTGATDELDVTGRTSAVIGFATATVGLILSAVSLAATIPSGGSSTLTAAVGIKLIIAGVGVTSATAGTVYAGRNAIKTFKETDATNIDWSNIDWKNVGVASAEKAIENAADGYMWGSIIGTVHGGAEGYEYYHKYNTPYTNYQKRIDHLKQMKTKGLGEWTGKVGESEFILKEPIILNNGVKITKVAYKNGIPDFSPYAIAEVNVPKMTNDRTGKGGNYEQADAALAEYWSKIKYNNQSKWTSSDVRNFREEYPTKLTWHEMSNMESMQLVPFEVNDTFKHFGGVAEYNAMVGQKGGADFD